MKVYRASPNDKRDDGSRRWALVEFECPDDRLQLVIGSFSYSLSIDDHGGLFVRIGAGNTVRVGV